MFFHTSTSASPYPESAEFISAKEEGKEHKKEHKYPSTIDAIILELLCRGLRPKINDPYYFGIFASPVRSAYWRCACVSVVVC